MKKSHSGDMASSPHEDWGGGEGKGEVSFCLRGALLWRTLVGGKDIWRDIIF